MGYKRATPSARRDIAKASREAKKTRTRAMNYLKKEEVKALKADKPEVHPPAPKKGFEITIKVN